MKINSAFVIPLVIICTLALTRLLPHLPNFAPITAMALFGGVYLNKRYAFIVPIIAMIISDYLLLYINPFSGQVNFTELYSPLLLINNATWAVYSSFLISGTIGLWLKDHKTPTFIILGSFFCSMQFFLITNAAVWIGGAYDRSFIGLLESYIAGIPFLQGTLFGDFFYTGLLFGTYELVLRFAKRRSLAFA